MKNNFLILTLGMILLISFAIALPVPSPHAFHGSVSDSYGNLVDSGEIVAKIDFSEDVECKIENGSYGEIGNCIVLTNDCAGLINFYFENNLIGTFPFECGAVTKLDFVVGSPMGFCGDGILDSGEGCDFGINNGVVCDNSTSSCSYCSSSCSVIILPYYSVDEEDDCDCCDDDESFYDMCESNWDCSGWTSCSNNVKRRTCTDTNYCDYAYNKPTEAVGCESPVLDKSFIEEKIESVNYLLIFGIIFALLLIILITLLRK